MAFLPPLWAISRDRAAKSYLNVERYSDALQADHLGGFQNDALVDHLALGLRFQAIAVHDPAGPSADRLGGSDPDLIN